MASIQNSYQPDPGYETMNIGAHNLRTGDAVVFSGTKVGGLTDGATYYAIVDDPTTGKIRLAASSADALAGNAVNISSLYSSTSTDPGTAQYLKHTVTGAFRLGRTIPPNSDPQPGGRPVRRFRGDACNNRQRDGGDREKCRRDRQVDR
jgi:hypothetical protein